MHDARIIPIDFITNDLQPNLMQSVILIRLTLFKNFRLSRSEHRYMVTYRVKYKIKNNENIIEITIKRFRKR